MLSNGSGREQSNGSGHEQSNGSGREQSNGSGSEQSNGNSNHFRQQKNKKKKLKRICSILGLNIKQLHSCKDLTITKTCREIVRLMYPDKKSRAKKSVKKLGKKKVGAIRGKFKAIDHNSIAIIFFSSRSCKINSSKPIRNS